MTTDAVVSHGSNRFLHIHSASIEEETNN